MLIGARRPRPGCQAHHLLFQTVVRGLRSLKIQLVHRSKFRRTRFPRTQRRPTSQLHWSTPSAAAAELLRHYLPLAANLRTLLAYWMS